jgi:O-antigen/teichoic acid export membrane protein
MPKFAEFFKNNDRKGLSLLLLGTVGCTIIFGVIAYVGAIFFGDPVLVIIFGESISPYSYILYGIIVSVVFTSLLACMNTLLIAVRKLKSLALLLLFGCGVCYAVTPYLVNRFEMNGVAFSMIAGQLVVFILLTVRILWLIHNMQNKTGLRA